MKRILKVRRLLRKINVKLEYWGKCASYAIHRK